ncbi:chemotaxis response regulator protein-glutamate methylesterase [Sphingomonas sp. PP-CC-3G-468]|uniref:protein-glutamate methylesterase/protein-glutamine glutaminase n=1 Tax=Sphingomonas sp. PP-CC-3G-468 TaxID=2135656 RepID=UPI00104D9358|nr:chemotaxis response regulator protein-glutamate methylesterase [Sphingomonas sp. PP-CC-3G-468]TCM00505.1 two-component system chemotaxis response regulator CheB [Sphingomonas sp. PP-CC-3G-468]
MTVRTLIIDDSATMRAIIATVLKQDPEIEVVGGADGPVRARDLIKALDPDVITLDVEMPGMDGFAFLEKIMRLRPTPVVMISGLTHHGAEATLKALELGAYDCLGKPGSDYTDTTVFGQRLAAMLKAAARSKPRVPRRSAFLDRPTGYVPRHDALIAIGSSTGGVEALIELLGAFPTNCPPTVIVQHMPPTFTATLAARLDRLTAPKVVEAKSGQQLEVGTVYLAPGGDLHLEIVGLQSPRCRLVDGDRVSGHRPSVDQLFHSVATNVGSSAVGAILTGMGADGALGLKAMRDRGSVTIGQNRESCVVYGMPAVARKLGAVQTELPLPRIAQRLLQECRA